MDSVNRWCEKCFSNTPHITLDSDKIMIGKKQILNINVRFMEGKNVCLNFEVWPSLHIKT
jgi:hypothetical protein